MKKSLLYTRCYYYSLFLVFILLFLGCKTTNFPSYFLQENKTALFWPQPPQTPKIQFLTSIYNPSDIGIKTSWLEKTIDTVFGSDELPEILIRPYNVFVTSSKLYVTDPGAHLLHIFNLESNNYVRINNAGSEELQSPIGVVVDENGYIYLTDSILRKIFVYNNKGKFSHEIRTPQKELLRPTGIALSKDRIYVIDTLSHCVLVFNKKGEFLFSFGNQGNQKAEFNYPTNIFIDKKETLYILDSLNFRVQIFDKDGNFISMFGKTGDGSGDLSKPKGIAVDSEGHIYVSDAHFDNVQIFDREGRLLLVFGKTGFDDGQMILPAGIFIDDKDTIYVADSYNHRIQVFKYLKEKGN